MATALEPSGGTANLAASAQALEVARAIIHFLSSIRTIDSVVRIGASATGGILTFWVMQHEEQLDDGERIFDGEYELRRTVGPIALDVRVIPLAEIPESALPPMDLLFERP